MTYASVQPRATQSVAWLISASKRPATNRILSPIFWLLSFILSLIFRTAFITLPAWLLWYIYGYFTDYWLSQYSGLFEPAWPIARTRLVILMAAIPTWGLFMSLGVVVWALGEYLVRRVMRRKRGGGDYEVAIPMDDVRPNGASQRPQTYRARQGFLRTHFLRIGCFFLFVSMALSGVYMFKTYELAEDHRYKADVETALRVPKESGYHDGSKPSQSLSFSLINGLQPRSSSPSCLTTTSTSYHTGLKSLPRSSTTLEP